MRSAGRRIIWKHTCKWERLVVALTFSLIAVGCSSEHQLDAPELNLPLPEGWSYQQNETNLLLASRSGDLRVTPPEGPRLWIHWVSKEEEYQGELVEELLITSPEKKTTVQVLEHPVRTRIGNVQATAIGLQTGIVRKRYIIANPGGDHVYTFILEAPAELWEEAIPVMEKIIDTVSFTAVNAGNKATDSE